MGSRSSTSAPTTNNTIAPNSFEGVGAASQEGDVSVQILDGGAIADAFDFSEYTAREAFDVGSESIAMAGNLAYEGLGLAGDAFGFAGDVVRDNQFYSENIFADALGFLSETFGKTETLINDTVTDTFSLATTAVSKSQESANETLVKYGAGALVVVAVAMIFMGRK